MPNIAKECRLHAKKAASLLNWCAAVEIKKSFRVFRAAYSIMESIKGSWKTRVYSRIFIDNIGNQGFIPEIIYYKKKTSKTYTNRSFPGTVNVSDPIISTGLSESILKKQTDKQMLLFKGRAIAANKNCKKILMVSNVCISLCLACKIPRGILRGCPRKNGEHNFSTFTDFLIIVQFWFLWFYPRALGGLCMTQCTRT